MIYTTDFTTTVDKLHIPIEYLELMTEQGLDGLTELIRVVVNQAMQIERENHLQAGLRKPCIKSWKPDTTDRWEKVRGAGKSELLLF